MFGTPWLPDFLCKHWFVSSVWNFCRRVEDVPLRETFHSSEERGETGVFAGYKTYGGQNTAIIRWPPRSVTALQVVRTSFLGPETSSLPPARNHTRKKQKNKKRVNCAKKFACFASPISRSPPLNRHVSSQRSLIFKRAHNTNQLSLCLDSGRLCHSRQFREWLWTADTCRSPFLRSKAKLLLH